MPSAFSVANSPLTANGTIAVTGAGYPSQYIRGDGTLADFPTSGGGGSSVSYYLNGGTSQGTIGGVTYYEMSKTADTGTMADFSLTGNGFIVAFLTDAGDPAQLNIPAGNWNYEIYASMSANGGTPEMYAELYKYDGTTFTLIATSPHEILYDGTALNLYTFAMTVPSTTLAITDRLAVKLYATNSGGKTTTVHTQDSHLCQIITTFSTGITALNGLTAQVQYFATGTSGTDFAISSATATHTFNLPVASATNTGKLSSTDWSTFNGKVPYTGATANVDLGTNSLFAYDLFANGNGTNNANLYLKQGTASLLIQNGYSNILATGTKIGFQVATSAIAAYYADLQFSSLTAQRTFTLPDITGTLALLEGTQTFTGVKTFDEGISLKSAAFPTPATGYSSIGGNSFGITIITKQSSTIYTSNLGFPAANRTFTFPNADGTIALLESTQTFSGVNTFSSASRNESGILLKNGTMSALAGYTGIGGGSLNNGIDIILNGGAFTQSLLFQTAAGYSYTFPAATGTIALTSNLSSYVPYTGATGAVNLGAFDLTVNSVKVGRGNGSISTNSVLGETALNSNTTGSTNTAIGYGALQLNTTGLSNTAIGHAALNYNTTSSWNTAVGVSALGLSTGGQNTAIGYAALSNNTTGVFNIAIGYTTGTSIVTGNYNTIIGNYAGTAAMSNNIVLADGAGTIRYQWNGTNNAFTGAATFSSTLTATQATFTATANTYAGGALILKQFGGTNPIYLTSVSGVFALSNGGSADHLTIASTGNATFSFTTSGYGITSKSTSNYSGILADTSTNTGGGYFGAAKNGTRYSIFGTTGAWLGDTSTDTAIVSEAASSNIKFYTNGSSTASMTITSGGNVLIGTTSDNGLKFQARYDGDNWVAGFQNYGSNAYGLRIDLSGSTGSSGGTAFQVYTQAGGGFKVANNGNVYCSLLSSNGTVSTQGGTGNLYVSSDADLKIEDGFVENGLEKVLALKPRYFYWKDKEAFSADRQLGFYAQEVNAVSEETANTPPEGCGWGIYDRGLVALLTKAVQEQQAIITSLQDRLDKLENK
jgi:hypothetical protein